MTDDIEVQIPYMRYDITLALVEGRVPIEGVTLTPSRSAPNGTNVTADGPVARGDFGIVDLNIGNWLGAIENGWELIGLPVFSKRKPVYTYLFCRTDRGIEAPRDLEGKRIGIRRYRSSTSLWLVGLLEHRHGVDRSKLRWVVGAESLDDPFGTFAYPGADLELAPNPKKSLFDQLLDGDVDAIMTDISDGQVFDMLEQDSRVKRLFADYEAEDERLYQETGIYPPAHILALSKKLDREHPELAGKLYRALERSKEIAYEEILNDRGSFSVPYLRERFLEARERWGDPFAYGITANKPVIDAFIQYHYEQGFTKQPKSYEEVFAASTLDT